MAGATTIIAAGSLALAAGQTAASVFAKKKQQKALENLEVPELDRAFENIQISTEGSDLLKEENQRQSAMLIDAAKDGGVRSVMGSLPVLAAQNNIANREARAYLDDQIIRRDYAQAGDDTRIRQMNENRYMGDVQGLNNAIQASNQDIWSGVRGIGNSIMYAGRNGMFNSTPQVNTVNAGMQMQPVTMLNTYDYNELSSSVPRLSGF